MKQLKFNPDRDIKKLDNKCINCGGDVIYLGKNNHPNIQVLNLDTYDYICSECANVMWSSYKMKCKYKWYNYDKEKLKKLINYGE